MSLSPSLPSPQSMVERCAAAQAFLPRLFQNPDAFRRSVQEGFGEEWDTLPNLRSFFTLQQQERVRTIAFCTMVSIAPLLANGSVGLGSSVVRISRTVLKIFEELQETGGVRPLALTLQSIGIALEKMDPNAEPIAQFNLFRQY